MDEWDTPIPEPGWRSGPGYQLRWGEAIDEMVGLNSGSVGMILTDPPFGVTSKERSGWNNVEVDWTEWWKQARRVLALRRAAVVFAVQPFLTDVIAANRSGFKYVWVWVRDRVTGFYNAKKLPMRAHCEIAVFGRPTEGVLYNPQGLIEVGRDVLRSGHQASVNYGLNAADKQDGLITIRQTHTGYPRSILEFPMVHTGAAVHPTQKPVPLLEYLIRTYTNPGDLVLDPFMGSGSTGVAAARTGRPFLGVDLLRDWVDVAAGRIEAERDA